MSIDVLNWRGKFLRSGKDQNDKKYIALNGNKSELYIPIQIEENTTYKIKMELKNESGNGILCCNLFGNKNFEFGEVCIKCDSFCWKTFNFTLTTKTFPKTLPFYFRFLRNGGVGVINIANISIEKENFDIKTEKKQTQQVVVEKEIIKKPVKEIIHKNANVITLDSGYPEILNKKSEDLICLFVPYYIDLDFERQNEIDFCVEKNIENKFVSKIYLFSDTDNVPKKLLNDKVEVISLKEWPTFNYIIKFINNNELFDNSYNIILNTDMYLDETINLIKTFDLNNSCIALSVWCANLNKILNEYSAQGAWVFKGKVKTFDFIVPVGKPGCDNRLLFELYNINYTLYNLGYDIIVKHNHKSNYRKYSKKDTIPRPYAMISIKKKVKP